MTVLIAGGTTSFDPLRNVLCALHFKLEMDIEAVYLIDNDKTVKYLGTYSDRIKETLGKTGVMIASLQVAEEDASDKIPNFMSRFVLREGGRNEDVVVDLTTGPKFITSPLYAAANFCRIDRIYYFLLKNFEKKNIPFEELDPDDYAYLPLPPFSSDSLYNLGRRSYLELIFYLKEVEDLVACYGSCTPDLADKIDQSLRFAVRNYFEEDYRGAIRSIGSLMEKWTDQLYRFWEDREEVPRLTSNRNWASYTKNMRKLFHDLQWLEEGKKREGFDDQLLKQSIQIATVNDLLEVVRPFRNLAAHRANLRYQPTKDDAKLILDIALNIIRKFRGTVFVTEHGSTSL